MHLVRSRLLLCLALLLGTLCSTKTRAQTTPAQVMAFVKPVYIEGVPYAQASQLSADVALPVLQQVLKDPGQQDAWANAAVTAGMLGDDRSVDLLLEFITRSEGSELLSAAQTVAKTSAVMSLGYVVNKTGNRRALDFLRGGIDTGAWSQRGVTWIGGFQKQAKDRDRQLALMSVLGLGLAGNAEASEVLRSLQEAKTPQLKAIKERVPNMNSAARDALKAGEEIATDGMTKYYLRVQPKTLTTVSPAQPAPAPQAAPPKGPTTGQIIRVPTKGEVLKQPQPGELTAPPGKGRVIRAPLPGKVIRTPN